MGLLKINTFEEGLERVISTVLNGQTRPVIVSINWSANSGKTELRKKAHENLDIKHGKRGWIGLRGDSLDRFIQYPEGPDYFLIEDTGPFPLAADNYALEFFGKKPDLRVYINRKIPPELVEKLTEREYDLVIENSTATNK